jgi:hypothetical protein|tara:strand:- start:928 stop:1050 length:123 start_codon:yes stop_codon:yes gene_type:complete
MKGFDNAMAQWEASMNKLPGGPDYEEEEEEEDDDEEEGEE